MGRAKNPQVAGGDVPADPVGKPVDLTNAAQAAQDAKVAAQGKLAGNMDIWERVEKTDPKYAKNFQRRGGFKGTAINMAYIVKKATSVFGPVGIGWGWDEVEHIMVEGVWCSKVALWYVHNGRKSEPVVQWGQTEMVGQYKDGGKFVDDEAPKKSITDALSKILSYLGFGADVHMGMYDDQKYVNEIKKEFAEEKAVALAREEREQKSAGRSRPAEEEAPAAQPNPPAASGPARREPGRAEKSQYQTALGAVETAKTQDFLKKCRLAYESKDRPEPFTDDEIGLLNRAYEKKMAELAQAGRSAGAA